MDHNSYYQPFNHPYYPPASELPPYYAPASPSDFIYNSSANATASIFQSSRPFQSSFSNEPTFAYPPGTMGYGPSRPVEQSYPTYLSGPSLPEPSPRLPEPTPGLAEHRRQRQSGMSMGPGPSKSVPPPLALDVDRGSNRGSNSSSNESMVVVKQEEGSSSPVLVSMPMKKWEPRMPRMPTEGPGQQIKIERKGKGKERLFDPFGNVGLENGIGGGRGSGSGSGSDAWEERGEGVVVERVIPPMVPSIGMGMGMGMGTDMGMGMGMGMEPTIMPKMGLFKPIRWDGPSSSASRSSRSSKAKARRARAWEVEEGNDVPLKRTYGTQNQNRNENRNRNGNEETEDEQPSNAPISSSTHPRSSKRLKTSTSPSGSNVRSESAETETETETTITVKIKQEPGLSPSPSAIFAQIPMYNGTINNTAAGYESLGSDNPPSSRSISPLTRIPTPRRLLFPSPNRTSTGTNSQLSLRGVSRQLKKRDRQVALDREGSREESRETRERRGEHSRERRGEGFWSLAGGGQAQARSTAAAQDEEIGEWASPRQQQQQQQHRGSSEEREEGWTTISGSSEEGEVSSHYKNSYSCGQERNDDAPGNTHQSSPFLPYTDQEWCHPFSSSSAAASPAHVPGSSSSARYGPGSAPSVSASQERVEQYQQAIQMVQDTCLEATKRYIRAHCVNRGARGGGSPDTNPASCETVETVETRSARKQRRKRKLETRHAFCSSSIFSSSSPSPPPPRRRRRDKGKRQKRTTTPPSSPNSQAHNDIPCTDSLLPNISQICTLLWSRSQSLRLHDIDSIELHTARNMYWLLSWAETVAFAVPPTPTASIPDSTSGRTSVGSSFPGFGVSSLENLAASGRGQWNRPSASFSRRYRDRYRDRDLDRDWGVEHAISPWGWMSEGLNDDGYMWRRRNSEEGGGFEMLESRNGAVWEQQRVEMKRVFDEGGMLCEFLGYGEGVERIARVREFYGF